jgi:hypothetical protein
MQLQRAKFVTQNYFWCSSDTLSIERLAFGREPFTKGPDVIRQARQWRQTLPSSGTKRTAAFALVQRQLLLQAQVRSRDIVESLDEDHPLPCIRSVSRLP